MWGLKSKKPEQRENLQDKNFEQNKTKQKTRHGERVHLLEMGDHRGGPVRDSSKVNTNQYKWFPPQLHISTIDFCFK